MQKADIGIQTDALQRGSAASGQQTVGKGEHCIDIVQRRPPVSAAIIERLLAAQDHIVEYLKVNRRSRALQTTQRIE